MYRTIVIAFSTVDGIIEDPDGTPGTPNGGWAFRHGPEAVAGDKFKSGPRPRQRRALAGPQDLAAVLQHLAQPDRRLLDRHEPHPQAGGLPRRTDLSAWENSSLITGELPEAVAKQTTERDVIVAGSASVVHALAEQNLVDEYRILVFPELVGQGTKLFTNETVPAQLRLVSAEIVGPAVLTRYERAAV